MSRSLRKGDPEKVVILLFKPDSVSINGKYTIKPRLIMFSGEVRELDAFEIIVNSGIVLVDHHQPESRIETTEL